MNLVFMNIEGMHEAYEDLKIYAEDNHDRDIAKAFKQKLLEADYELKFRKKTSDGRARMRFYRDITPQEYFDLIQQSKYKFDEKTTPGLENDLFLQKAPVLDLSFIEFLNFFIRMAVMLPTEVK